MARLECTCPKCGKQLWLHRVYSIPEEVECKFCGAGLMLEVLTNTQMEIISQTEYIMADFEDYER